MTNRSWGYAVPSIKSAKVRTYSIDISYIMCKTRPNFGNMPIGTLNIVCVPVSSVDMLTVFAFRLNAEMQKIATLNHTINRSKLLQGCIGVPIFVLSQSMSPLPVSTIACSLFG